MSKERARTREARAQAAEQADAERRARRAAEVATATGRRERRARRERFWRRLRLWQHDAYYARSRERWAALVIGVLAVVLVTYLMTRSIRDTLVVALVAVVAAPMLIAFVVQRPRR